MAFIMTLWIGNSAVLKVPADDNQKNVENK